MNKKDITTNISIVFFDGVCGLCNNFVRFVIKRNSKRNIKFCWLQSNNAHEILINKNVVIDMDTIILMENENIYYESEAFFKIISKLDFPVKILVILSILPRIMTDFAYRRVARNRYKIFGKSEACEIPQEDYKDLFI